MKLEIYTMKECGYCTETKEYLNKEKVSYTEKDIDENREEWNSLIALTGMAFTPTLVSGDLILIPGRDYENIEDIPYAIEIGKKTNNTYQHQQVLQKLKTFEYNITEALEYIIEKLEEK